MRSTLFLLVIIHGSIALGVPRAALKLSTVLSFKIGVTTKQELSSTLGKADETSTIKASGDSPYTAERWEYLQNGVSRLTLTVGSEQKWILDGWAWSIMDRDPEKDLKTALRRFPDASWKVEPPKWVSPHHNPSECYFVDKEQHISIEYNRERKEVNSIARWAQTRTPSSAVKEAPPKFCIGDSCTDATPGDQWAMSWPLCKVPE